MSAKRNPKHWYRQDGSHVPIEQLSDWHLQAAFKLTDKTRFRLLRELIRRELPYSGKRPPLK